MTETGGALPEAGLRVAVWICADCGAPSGTRAADCRVCGGPLGATEVSGDGRLVSWTVVRRPADAFAGAGPMTIGLVDIDQGPRLTARLPALPEDTPLGARVRVTRFESGVPVCELA